MILSKELIELLILWIQLLGVPVGIGVFVYGKFREIKDRESRTYSTLGDCYDAYLRTCLENPDLPAFGNGSDVTEPLSGERRKRMQLLFCLLLSLHERAFLLYRDTRSGFRKVQWQGWVGYLEDCFKNPHFSREWPLLSYQFDQCFVDFAEGIRTTMISRAKK